MFYYKNHFIKVYILYIIGYEKTTAVSKRLSLGNMLVSNSTKLPYIFIYGIYKIMSLCQWLYPLDGVNGYHNDARAHYVRLNYYRNDLFL